MTLYFILELRHDAHHYNTAQPETIPRGTTEGPQKLYIGLQDRVTLMRNQITTEKLQ